MTADDVVSAGRGWLNVPFAHQGRTREGIDCAGLVICLARELGVLAADFDITGYERLPDGSMRGLCDRYLTPAPAQPGGIALMRFKSVAQHLAILAPYSPGGLSVIHALERNKRVVEHRLDAIWRARIVQTYIMHGMTGSG